MLRNKYLGCKSLSQIYWKNGDTHLWASLIMSVKQDSLCFGSFIIKGDSEIRLWEDRKGWLM